MRSLKGGQRHKYRAPDKTLASAFDRCPVARHTHSLTYIQRERERERDRQTHTHTHTSKHTPPPRYDTDI